MPDDLTGSLGIYDIIKKRGPHHIYCYYVRPPPQGEPPRDTAEVLDLYSLTPNETFGRFLVTELGRQMIDVQFEEGFADVCGEYEKEVSSLRSENGRLRDEIKRLELSRTSEFTLPDNYFDEESEGT